MFRLEKRCELYHQWRKEAEQACAHMDDAGKHAWAMFNVRNHPDAKFRIRIPWRIVIQVACGIFLLLLGYHCHAQAITPVVGRSQIISPVDGSGNVKVNCMVGCTAGGGGSAITTWGGGTLGAMAAYGTSPGAVLVPGVNAFITNTVPVTGTFWQATQPVSGTFWQATQPVSGTFWQATQPVSIASMPSTPVTGTFWQATQPVSGTFFQATQPVSIASMPTTPVTGTFFQATQPVSGTVTANQGTSPWVANVSQFGGNNVATGTGAGGVGIPRVTVSNDSQVRVLGNAGATLDAAPAAALPTNAQLIAGRDSTQTGGGTAVPVVCDKSAAITATAAASVVVIALAASKTTYICGFVITGAGAAGTMQWKSGTGTTCGTGTANLTGAMATAIGGTVSYGNGFGTIMRHASAAQDTCITMATASATAAGVVSYAQF